MKFELPYRFKSLHTEVRGHLAGREEVEPIFELPRSGTVPRDAVLCLCSANHQPAAHRTRHESGGREFIDGQHDHLDCACEDHSFLDERQM
ncbi:hypothetical protein K0M31_011101 [Melipona bicolor]|uniref:Uncharacterized protein n=1 Tax=Melipona bicolor TaxID=60889 RepID=A0AA40G8W7_9HYME|nr:hypothetical protein K0M31_011101 [Melipona bicolor]